MAETRPRHLLTVNCPVRHHERGHGVVPLFDAFERRDNVREENLREFEVVFVEPTHLFRDCLKHAEITFVIEASEDICALYR